MDRCYERLNIYYFFAQLVGFVVCLIHSCLVGFGKGGGEVIPGALLACHIKESLCFLWKS